MTLSFPARVRPLSGSFPSSVLSLPRRLCRLRRAFHAIRWRSMSRVRGCDGAIAPAPLVPRLGQLQLRRWLLRWTGHDSALLLARKRDGELLLMLRVTALMGMTLTLQDIAGGSRRIEGAA